MRDQAFRARRLFRVRRACQCQRRLDPIVSPIPQDNLGLVLLPLGWQFFKVVISHSEATGDESGGR